MSKSALFILISVFIVSCVNGQAGWLQVAQGVSNDVVNLLANFPLPIPLLDNFATPPSAPIAPRPPTAPPTPRITLINGHPCLVFDSVSSRPTVPAPTPSLPNIRDPWDAVEPLMALYRLLNRQNTEIIAPLRNLPSQIIALPNHFDRPSPSPSPSHHGQCHSECGCGCKGPACKPERVRIVVVDDCNDKKKKSSESCSSESNSDEVDIVVPRTGKRTVHYSVKGKK